MASEKIIKNNKKDQEEEPLIKGFETDDSTLTTSANVSKDNKHTIKKLDKKKQAEKKNSKENDTTTTPSRIIYVGRLPNGFHEDELAKYFSQFGDLKDVRLARNKKTGKSRHYAFIEFVNKDDAKIACETMDNYLVMGHLLSVKLLTGGDEKIQNLRRYRPKVITDNKIEKNAKELKIKANVKHNKRLQKLAEKDIDFKF
ncbi:related to Ribosome biogenesis protein 15 [Saccharomycodes ludwigii]|uniref:Related to Ribosome biogenesis protein 15 n=1 Tax=Saccharomycodes ludwigii TaxID=36035 RepID=A0A376B3G4_9ASCO|nr:related to Ribosome biogenesis protein 15 [Saccharomycodes ludwigii]